MLRHLYIKQFTIITELELELNTGLTVLTGETGAGKSILLDALELVTGARADTGLIQANQTRCEVAATFDLTHIPFAKQWLIHEDMDEENECVIRRIITQDGRSRSLLNGRPCTLQQVREFAELLVHIHGQNQHQQLLKNDYQRLMLDDFAKHHALYEKVCTYYKQWQTLNHELTLCYSHKNQPSEKELLLFQLDELDQLNLLPNELNTLQEEHTHLAHAEQWIITCQNILNVLSEDEQMNVVKGLYTAHQQLKTLPEKNQTVSELIQQSLIQTQEAVTEIQSYLDKLEPNPVRLQWIDKRFSQIHDLARKHKVQPEELSILKKDLENRLKQWDGMEEKIAELTRKIETLTMEYQVYAHQLTESRRLAAETFSHEITAQLQLLGMPTSQFCATLVPLETNILHPHGNERIEFLVRTNPGQPLQPLNKVVSGGELSRIALAIQVIAAQASTLPTLIFDEVDVGIGGGTAEIVGQQLRKLAENTQVLCVTHLPQVASKGNHHLSVKKNITQDAVHTEIHHLSPEEKIQEIARMLGGVNITQKTLDHAREMLEA